MLSRTRRVGAGRLALRYVPGLQGHGSEAVVIAPAVLSRQRADVRRRERTGCAFKYHAKRTRHDPAPRPCELGPADPPPPRVRPCVGCGRCRVHGWAYCPRCRDRMERSGRVDQDSDLTFRDALRIGAFCRIPGFRFGPGEVRS